MSSPQKSSFKFPKALAAAGLAAVLVGCGGGSESARTGNDNQPPGNTAPRTLTLADVPNAPSVTESFTLQPGTSKTLINGNHVVTCPRGGAACQVDVDSGNKVTYTGGDLSVATTAQGLAAIAQPGKDAAALAKSKEEQERNLMGKYEAALTASNNLRNYSTDGIETDIEDINQDAHEAIIALENELNSEETKKYIETAKQNEYRTKIRNLKRRVRDNAEPAHWLAGFEDWDDDGVLNRLVSSRAGVSTNEITVTDAERTAPPIVNDKTDIHAGSLTDRKNTEGPGGVWTAVRFETNNDDSDVLKVFTNRSSANEEIESTEWGEFWDDGLNNDHYENAKIFGTGASNVDVTVPAAPAANATLVEIGANNSLTQPVITKVHRNDVVLRNSAAGQGEVILTRTVRQVVNNNTQANGSTGNIFLPPGLAGTGIAVTANADESLFLGVEGRFSCTLTGPTGEGNPSDDAACGLSIDPDGFIMVSLLDTSTGQDADTTDATGRATLTFWSEDSHEANENRQVEFDRPDTTYITMGYWMNEEGTIIDTFAKARYWYGDLPKNASGLADDITEVKGRAEYRGAAVGAYVMNRGSDGILDLDNGEFKAEVELTADFTGTASNNVDPFKVSGTIDEFDSLTDNKHDSHLSSWSLTLNESTVNTRDGAFSGSTGGGGEWQGQFYGNTGIETSKASDDFPEAAVGEFSGDFGNYNEVIGVFGTEKN